MLTQWTFQWKSECQSMIHQPSIVSMHISKVQDGFVLLFSLPFCCLHQALDANNWATFEMKLQTFWHVLWTLSDCQISWKIHPNSIDHRTLKDFVAMIASDFFCETCDAIFSTLIAKWHHVQIKQMQQPSFLHHCCNHGHFYDHQREQTCHSWLRFQKRMTTAKQIVFGWSD